MLLAARALTYVCDVLPSYCSAVVQYGVVSAFCSRLLTIEFMDLSEHVINDVYFFVYILWTRSLFYFWVLILGSFSLFKV